MPKSYEPIQTEFCLIALPANAWEEGDDVVLITCRLQNPDLDAINGTEKEQQRDGFTNEL